MSRPSPSSRRSHSWGRKRSCGPCRRSSTARCRRRRSAKSRRRTNSSRSPPSRAKTTTCPHSTCSTPSIAPRTRSPTRTNSRASARRSSTRSRNSAFPFRPATSRAAPRSRATRFTPPMACAWTRSPRSNATSPAPPAPSGSISSRPSPARTPWASRSRIPKNKR